MHSLFRHALFGSLLLAAVACGAGAPDDGGVDAAGAQRAVRLKVDLATGAATAAVRFALSRAGACLPIPARMEPLAARWNGGPATFARRGGRLRVCGAPAGDLVEADRRLAWLKAP